MTQPRSYVPKGGLPYPTGRTVAGRIVSRISPALYKIELSGRFYTAEMSQTKSRIPFSPGDPVYVRVVARIGNKAMLEIVEPEYPDIDSPSDKDIAKLAAAAGWPADEAAHALVEALIARRLPLRSELADRLYRRLKSLEHPSPAAAEKLLVESLAE